MMPILVVRSGEFQGDIGFPARFARTMAFVRRVSELRGLSAGWDSYGAEPPSEVAIGLARDALVRFAVVGLEPDQVVPSADGGVCIAFWRGGRYADVEAFNTGELFLGLIDREGGVSKVQEVTEEERRSGAYAERLMGWLSGDRMADG